MNTQTAPIVQLARIKHKGQVTIPARLRGEFGLSEGDYVALSRDGNKIVLTLKAAVDRYPEVDVALEGAFADERAERVSPSFKSVGAFQTWRKTKDYKKFIGKK